MKIIFYLLLSAFIYPQPECDGLRYNDEIFSQVNITSNVLYGGNYNSNIWGNQVWEDLYLDIYEPAGDDVEDRPLIFFLFGGSFVLGSKTSPDIVELCTRYAKMGYVAAAIDYRLTGELVWLANEEKAYEATAKAIHDLKGAIRWFRMNDELYNNYRIDNERIYAGGVSAGGIATVNAAYLDEDEIPDVLEDYIAENGGLEGESGSPGYDSNFHAVINLCGAVGDYNWIEAGDIPVVNVHGDEDSIVPYGDGLITLFGLNMQVYGSFVIHETMISLSNTSALYTFEGEDHTPFINSSEAMDITVEFTREFMADLVCTNAGIPGDLNNDEVLNILDVVLMVNIILDGEDHNPAGDMNSDGIINILDIVQLVNLILGE